MSFHDIYVDLYTDGHIVSPRGMKVKEIEDYTYILKPYERFANFKERKINLKYLKTEFLWYLKGNRWDTSITEYAKLWKDHENKDGSFNSNYGQYFFENGKNSNWNRLIKELLLDKDSRRASIMILNNDHLNSDTNDVPCTLGLNFRIRKNKLNCTIQMRSQDAVFGMGNDVPTFSFIHEMAYITLRDLKYQDLQLGNLSCFVNSFHIYERHFELLDNIVANNYIEIDVPRISGLVEVENLIKTSYLDFPFTNWLTKEAK